MKITDDILKAMHKCVENIGSKNAFAQRANVSINTITKYLTRKTQTINDETWVKLQPLLRPFMSREQNAKRQMAKLKKEFNIEELSSNEKILLDAFAELSPEQQNRKLIEIVELARERIGCKND